MNIHWFLLQVVRVVFDNWVIANIFYGLVQMASAAILFTDANASFNEFPALAISGYFLLVWFCVVEGCGGLCGGDRWCGLCWWFRVGRGVGGLLARAAE
nr:hypothetical protein [Mycobacterium lepromatosis]